METGRSVDSLTVADDDQEGHGGTSPSLAPFLARLCRDDRLGWSSWRTRPADDTDSLNVNVSDCGSCHLSEVSSVSSWLNDTSAVDDDRSSCAPDDETGSEKDDVDEDEGDVGSEIRPLFLLQRCLEEKLLEQQQSGNEMVYAAGDCDRAVSLVTDNVADTSTMKRVSRNLCTFKESGTADNCVNVEDSRASDASNGAAAAFGQPMPLRRSGSRGNPDSLICAGAIYDFNSNTESGDVAKSANRRLVNEKRSDAVEDVGSKQKSGGPDKKSLPPVSTFIKNTSPVKDVETLEGFATISKPRFADISLGESKLIARDSGQSILTCGADAEQVPVANDSASRKPTSKKLYPAYNGTVVQASNKTDSTLVIGEHHISCQSTSPASQKPSAASSVKSTQRESGAETGKSISLVPVDDRKAKADNVDAESEVSDEAEKTSETVGGSVAMPSVEDGLSNSDISDVDEAFSMFAGLKPPDPVPVDTSFGARSPTPTYSNPAAELDEIEALGKSSLYVQSYFVH